MIGIASRNEKRAADSRSMPMARAAVIVTPERDTPGCNASAWASPKNRPVWGRIGVQIAIASADPVDDVEDHAEDREHHGDQPRLTERVLDRALEQRSGDRPGDRADHERPRESFVDRADRASSDRRDPCLEVAPEIDPEIDHGPQQRPDVERDVEGLVERRILDDGPPEEPRDQDQVSAAGDRSELRDALGHPQDDRLQDGHARPSGREARRVYPEAGSVPGEGDGDGVVPTSGPRATSASVPVASAWSN